MGALFNLAMIGNTFATTAVLQRFLASIAYIVLLTVMAAVMGSLLLSAGFYGLYLGLCMYLDLLSAGIIVASLVFVLTAVLISMAMQRMRQLKRLSQTALQRQTPMLSRMGGIVDAFMDGLTMSKTPERD